MRFLTLLIVIFVGISFSKYPRPFGLELGKTSEKEFLRTIKKKGWRVVESGYKVIEADITNPEVTGYIISGINLEKLKKASFWFYKGTLFKIVYTFNEDMEKSTFYLYFDQLRAKYGKPKSYIKPWLSNGEAVWVFGNIKLELYCPWVSRETYILYLHTPLNKKVKERDDFYYMKFIKEKSKNTEGL